MLTVCGGGGSGLISWWQRIWKVCLLNFSTVHKNYRADFGEFLAASGVAEEVVVARDVSVCEWSAGSLWGLYTMIVE